MSEQSKFSHNEQEPQPEITRQQVIQAFSKLSGDGNLAPTDLDFDDHEVTQAKELFDKWQKQQKTVRFLADEEDYFRLEAQSDILFVDAGFHDKDYLDVVANEWLVQTLDRIKSLSPGLMSLIEEVEARRAEINAKLNSEVKQNTEETAPKTQELLE